jgi:hypothetical protein
MVGVSTGVWDSVGVVVTSSLPDGTGGTRIEIDSDSGFEVVGGTGPKVFGGTGFDVISGTEIEWLDRGSQLVRRDPPG